MPSTPTMAAMPMLIPSADKKRPDPPAAQPEAADPQQVPPGQPGAAGVGVTSRSAYHG